jgi:hypothetical protein
MNPESIGRHSGAFLRRGDHGPKETEGQLTIYGLCGILAGSQELYSTQIDRA